MAQDVKSIVQQAIDHGIEDPDVLAELAKRAQPVSQQHPNDPSMLPGAGKTRTQTTEDNIRPGDVRGVGDYARRELAAAGTRVRGIGDALAHKDDAMVPGQPRNDVGKDILGIISGIAKPIKQAYQNTIGSFGSLSPEEAGAGTVDAAANLGPLGIPGTTVPAVEGAINMGKAVGRGVATAAKTPVGAFAVSHAMDALPGSTARAIRMGSAAQLAAEKEATAAATKTAAAEKTAIPGPKPRLSPRGADVMSADMLAELEKRIPGVVASHDVAPSLEDVMAEQLRTREGVGSAVPSSGARATGQVVPAADEFGGGFKREGGSVESIPSTDASLRGTPPAPSPNAGGRMVPKSVPGIVQQIDEALARAKALDAAGAPAPASLAANPAGGNVTASVRPLSYSAARTPETAARFGQPRYEIGRPRPAKPAVAGDVPRADLSKMTPEELATITKFMGTGLSEADKAAIQEQLRRGMGTPGHPQPHAAGAGDAMLEDQMNARYGEDGPLPGNGTPGIVEGPNLSKMSDADKIALKTHLSLKLQRTPMEQLTLDRLNASMGGVRNAARANR